MSDKFILAATRDGSFHFNLKAGNSEIILSSHSSASKEAAKNGIESARNTRPRSTRPRR
jgi:uncharacterized protein